MQRAGSLIPKLKLSPEMDDPEVRARAAWPLAAGEKIARHTLAASLVRGKLIVEVEDMVWQRNLHGLRSFLLRNLAQALGEPLVTDIDFRPMPRRLRPQRAESARPTLDPSGIADPVMAMLYRKSKQRESA
jgi:predicted nucleic acid-binding Zn ribbon protein